MAFLIRTARDRLEACLAPALYGRLVRFGCLTTGQHETAHYMPNRYTISQY